MIRKRKPGTREGEGGGKKRKRKLNSREEGASKKYRRRREYAKAIKELNNHAQRCEKGSK